MNFNFSNLPALEEASGLANVIIDTPKGSRNKFKFDEQKQLFKLKHVLPAGSVFPFDFGFLPNTITEDGDPLDVIVFQEAPTFPGCLIEVRIIGVLEAEQTGKEGKTEKNHRLIGVFHASEHYKNYHELTDIPKDLLEATEHFFINYNRQRGIDFKILHRSGQKKALSLINQGIEKRKQQ